MDFRILGPLEVLRRGQRVDPVRPKQRELLAILILHANEVVPTDHLIEALWEDEVPEDASGALQIHMSRLRKALSANAADEEPLIVTHKAGYQLRVQPDELDAWQFERLFRQAKAALEESRPATSCETLTAALRLSRGPVLADFSSADFAQAEIARLSELHLVAIETLVDAKLALGLHREVVGDLDALVSAHPLRERLWVQRMTALYRCGRQADALRSYQELRRVLGEQLGINPSIEASHLDRAILLQDPGLDRAPARFSHERRSRLATDQLGETGTPHSHEGNLPVQLTTFVGRGQEQADIAAHLSGGCRLLTLTGPPGCGKSRLALKVVAGVEPPPADGVWLVDLSSHSEATMVVRAVASVLEVREQPGSTLMETLTSALADKDLLLLLDNCEPVLAGCAQLAQVVMQRCPKVRILATSREPLGLSEEVNWPVPPLLLPKEEPPSGLEAIRRSDAVQLFLERVRLVRPDFALGEDNFQLVASICQRLDGLPLAIELAAALVGVLSLPQIAAGLDDRFRLLAGASPLPTQRHQTMHAALDWGHDRLGAAHQALLRRLSCFAGGWTLEAAIEVCAGDQVEGRDAPQLLDELVSKSFVVLEPLRPEPRYRLLDTIRQYARDRLAAAGERALWAERHASWYLSRAERAEPEMTSAHGYWAERLQADHDNLRAAFEWTVAHRRWDWSLRLAAALALFWRARGHYSEGREWCEAALDVAEDAPRTLRAKAAWTAGLMAAMLGEPAAALSRGEESLAVFKEVEDLSGWARSLLLVGNSLLLTGSAARALPLFEESEALARKAGDNWCLLHALVNSGQAAEAQCDYDEARARYEESLTVAQLSGDDQGVALGLTRLGILAVNRGDYEPAEARLNEALHLSEELGDPYETGRVLGSLGLLRLCRGDAAKGRELLERSLTLSRRFGAPAHAVFEPLCTLGNLALAEGQAEEARSFFEEALALARAADLPLGPALRGLTSACHAMGHEAAPAYAAEALKAFRASGDKHGMASALHDLGTLALCKGDQSLATSLYREALELYWEIGDQRGTAHLVEALSRLAAESDPRRAAVLLAHAHSMREAKSYAPSPPERTAYELAVGVARDQCGEDFEAAWDEGCALSAEDAVALALEESGGLAGPSGTGPIGEQR